MSIDFSRTLAGQFSRAAASAQLASWLAASVLVLAATGPSIGAASAPDMTVAQVIDKHIAARGGLRAWHAVHAMSWSGKVDAGTADSTARSARYIQGPLGSKREIAEAIAADSKAQSDAQVQLPFTLSMERPRKSRLELQFAGKTALQVYDGTNGWKLRPFLNRSDVEPFTADESAAEAQKDDLDGPLVDYVAKGTKVSLEGHEAVAGRDAYKLKLTMRGGVVRHVWIDAQSFLDVKVDGAARRMDGRMHNVFVYQRDFRDVQGVKVPFTLETVVEGYRDAHRMVIDKVAVNPPLDDSMFSKPGA